MAVRRERKGIEGFAIRQARKGGSATNFWLNVAHTARTIKGKNRMRRNRGARMGLVLGAILVVVLLVAVVLTTNVLLEHMPDANTPTDAFGNPSIGYADISATIPIVWTTTTCEPGACDITMGAFRPVVKEYLAQPSATAAMLRPLGATTAGLECTVSVQLEMRGPNGALVATQDSAAKTVTVGQSADVFWGHVYLFDEGYHTAYFTLYAQGGDGCPSYGTTPKAPGERVLSTSFQFLFDGVTT